MCSGPKCAANVRCAAGVRCWSEKNSTSRSWRVSFSADTVSSDSGSARLMPFIFAPIAGARGVTAKGVLRRVISFLPLELALPRRQLALEGAHAELHGEGDCGDGDDAD